MNAHQPIVAVVDDDPRMRESLQDLLESSGYAARTYPSAAALLATGLSGIDLLVTDIGMPGMDGFELEAVSRGMRPDLPVFLITARHELLEAAQMHHANRLFRKPLEVAALLEAVETALMPAKGSPT